MRTAVIGCALAAAGCADRAPAAVLDGAAAPGLTTLGASGTPAVDPGTGEDGGLPIAPAGALEIAPAPTLSQARYHHAAAAVRTPGGRDLVLVTGGENGSGAALAHAERFDPRHGTWSDAGTGGSAPLARTRHTATALDDGSGRVLLAGGHTGGNGPALATAEVYDAERDEFRLITSMRVPRTGHTATALPGGAVLVAGGYDAAGRPLRSCELFDPATESFTLCPAPLSAARAHHAAVLLADGRVLLTGGIGSERHEAIRVHRSADLWSGVNDVRPAADMAGPRAEHTATRLPSGLVLLAGGSTDQPERAARSDAEVFDAAAGPFGAFAMVTAPMATARSGHTATLVPGSNVVLLIGGATEPHPELCPVTVGIERFVPDALGIAPGAPYQGVTETGLFAEPLGPDGAPIGLPEAAQGLTAHVAVVLPGGGILVAGGADCAFAKPVAVARTAIATDSAAE